MPCTSDGYPTAEDGLRKDVDELTRLLCMSCQCLGTFQSGSLGNPELQAWWNAHQAADRAREDRGRHELNEQRKMRIVKMKNSLSGMEAKAAAYRTEIENLEGQS